MSSVYRHGVYAQQLPTSIVPPRRVGAALPVVVGAAPVHLIAEHSLGPINEPVLLYSYSEAVQTLGPVEVDWIRGRLYFTEADEGSVVTVGFNYARTEDPSNPGQTVVESVPPMQYRVMWEDEISTAIQPTDQTTNEVFLPTDAAVNEGQLAAFKDPFQDKAWVFWTSTRAGTTDLYYMTLCPAFYPEAGSP